MLQNTSKQRSNNLRCPVIFPQIIEHIVEALEFGVTLGVGHWVGFQSCRINDRALSNCHLIVILSSQLHESSIAL